MTLFADIKKAFDKHGTYASFAWDQLDRMPAYDIQPLAQKHRLIEHSE
jgi:hypothetical protein